MKIETVLMVDDDPSIRRIADLSLTRVGKWKVLLAESGAQAIELAIQHTPDVILMDVMMPQMDGPTALKHLREQVGMANTPVIFMTAKVLRQEMESYTALGAAGVIKKPFDPMMLPKTLLAILEKTQSGVHDVAVLIA